MDSGELILHDNNSSAKPKRQKVTHHTAIKKEVKSKWKRTTIAWLLLFPSFVFLFAFTIYPIMSSIYKSLFVDNLSTLVPRFNGLDNYIQLANDKIFWECFRNNLLIAVITIPASIGLAVAMAVFTHQLKRGKTLFRLGFIYPTFIPLVAAANIWTFIYTPIYGLIGYFNPNLRLLAESKTAIWAIIIMLIWKQAGYIMLFYIAGINGISRELYEAASMDGARGLRLFCSITWPMLKPTTMYVFMIAVTNAYKMVDHLYIMTKGGPGNSTNVLLYYIYQTGFDFWNTGMASTMTVVVVALLLIVTSMQFFREEKKAYYAD